MSVIFPIHDVVVQIEPVWIKKIFWIPCHLLEIFPSIVCSHPMCYFSVISDMNVPGSDGRLLIYHHFYIMNVVRTLLVVLDVDCFIHLKNFSIYFLRDHFNLECEKCTYCVMVYHRHIILYTRNVIIPRSPNFSLSFRCDRILLLVFLSKFGKILIKLPLTFQFTRTQ